MKFNVIFRASVRGTQKTSGSYLLMEVIWLEKNKSRTFCESINQVLFFKQKVLEIHQHQLLKFEYFLCPQ